jgi:hypothetical protein
VTDVSIRCCSRSLALAAALALLSVACLAGADKKTKPQSFEDRYDFRGGQPESYQGDSLMTRLRDVVAAKHGKWAARAAHAYPLYLRRGRSLGLDFYVEYPDLLEGDVAAFFGMIYRVDSVGGRGKTSHMAVKRVPADKLPRGLGLSWDSIVVPLSKDGRGLTKMHDSIVRVESIAAPVKEGGKAAAKILVSYSTDVEGEGLFDLEASVKVGDVVLLRKAGHRVRAIVPADAKTRVIGWVELDPNPLSEKDLAAKKIPLVRPQKRKK